MVPGAGATELELAKQISSYGEVSFSLTIFFCKLSILIRSNFYKYLNMSSCALPTSLGKISTLTYDFCYMYKYTN